MSREEIALRGEVVAELFDPYGHLVTRVRSRNTVLARGRLLVAALLAGKAEIKEHRIAIGDGLDGTKDDMEHLLSPRSEEVAEVKVLPEKECGVALVASLKVSRETNIRETGVRVVAQIHDDLRSSFGEGRDETIVLYNHAKFEAPIPLGPRDILNVSWTISFTGARK